jgi:hypothetical protein
MTTIHRRLCAGERIWAAEACFRLAGAGALAFCAWLARWLFRLVHLPPRHPASPLELAAAALAVVSLWAGLALVLEGPGLLRLMPRPPRALI